MKLYNEPCPREGFEDFMKAAKPRGEEFFQPFGAAPKTPAPNYIPNPANALTTPIANYLSSHCYVWLRGNKQFWFYPVRANEGSVAGYRWLNNDWVYMGFPINEVERIYVRGV